MSVEVLRSALMTGPYEMTIKEADRFIAKVDVRSGGECWDWLARLDRRGYGKFKFRGKMVLSHRLPAGIVGPLHGCHRCDRPSCCNPSHIFAGTPADNRADSVSKGRHEHGERHRSAKLTESAVREIRNRYAAGGVTLADLAGEFLVAPQVIHYAIRRVTWRHVA